jgi:hypothetical protein
VSDAAAPGVIRGNPLLPPITERDASDFADEYFTALRTRLRDRLDIRVKAGSHEGELRYLLLDL